MGQGESLSWFNSVSSVDIEGDPIDWGRLDVLIARSIYTPEQVYKRLDGFKYTYQIVDVINDLEENINDRHKDYNKRTFKQFVGEIPEEKHEVKWKLATKGATVRTFSSIWSAEVIMRVPANTLANVIGEAWTEFYSNKHGLIMVKKRLKDFYR